MDGILLNHIVSEEQVNHILYIYNDKNSYGSKLMIAIYDFSILSKDLSHTPSMSS